jgi:hypothetical protein
MVATLVLFMTPFFLVSPASAQGYFIDFWADRTQSWAGECINLYWDSGNVQAVYYNGRGVSGIDQTRVECPTQDTVYNLLVITRDGQRINKQVFVDVSRPPVGWNNWYNNVIIDFWADRTQLRAGECLSVNWNTNNVKEVYYNNQPVSGIYQTRLECPGEDATYNLLVITRNNQQILRQIYVDVEGESFDRGDLEMKPNQIVDLDNEEISSQADDFRWAWTGGEEGRLIKIDGDDDLRLALAAEEGSTDQFNGLSLEACREWLDDDDESEIKAEEGSIVCFRTDDDNYGKLYVTNIDSRDGQLEADWYVWR